MARKLGSRLEVIESLKQNVFPRAEESEGNSRNVLGDKITPRLAHKVKIVIVNAGRKEIRYCQRCKVTWPCLWAQEMAIERGARKRQRLDSP